MIKLDRRDVLPSVVLLVVAIAAVITLFIWLDSTKTSYAAPVETAHVPFTTKPVTPGDSQSYVDTVGQCPFYETASVKGCVPPPNLQCNADWSVCTQKDESVSISTPIVAPAPSQSVKPVTCAVN